jgi:DNA-binding NarL/FixJ family response regulator
MPTPIRVLLADDHQMVVQALSGLLNSFPDITVTQTVLSGEQALIALQTDPVDLVVSDIDMPPGMNGLALTREIKRLMPQVRVLLLSWSEEAGRIRDAVQAGADGYLPKRVDKETLGRAIRQVMAGEHVFDPALLVEAVRLPLDARAKERQNLLQLLTPRELEILQLLAQDLSVVQIAQQLNRSVATVETHRKNLKRKVGAKTMVQLIRTALKYGLISE